MKILYDYQAFDMQIYGGVSNSFVKLIENLPKNVDYEVAIRECGNVHLKASDLDVQCEPVGKYRLVTLGRNCWCSMRSLIKGDFDVFHPTFFKTYFLPFIGKKPFVLTVHDMIPELFFDKSYKQIGQKKLLCERAAHIIAVSDNSKKDLLEMLHVPEEKVTVIYHGAPDWQYDPKTEPIVDGRYFLFVGQRDSYKMFMPMLRSMKPVLKRHQDIRVVFTGQELTENEVREIKNLGVLDQLVHKKVSDNDMRNLYSHALCFVFPSVYEGFGIPILEAYRCHCPVLLNEASCFPEIAEDGAIYFHLNELSSDLEQVLERFLLMKDEERNNLLLRQNRRLDHFSWQKSSKQLAEVYASVI